MSFRGDPHGPHDNILPEYGMPRQRTKGPGQHWSSAVVFWRVPSELTSRHDCLLLGKHIGKEIFRFLPELESFVHIQDQRLHKRLGLLTTRFPNGFEG